MSDQLKTRLKELQLRKKELQPIIDELKRKRDEEIQNINKKYDHLIYDINYTAQQLEDEFYNDLINSFAQIVTREFDLKRSSDIYEVSDEFKDYRQTIAQFDMFPEELVNKLHRVINGEPIESIMYELDKIQKKYRRP